MLEINALAPGELVPDPDGFVVIEIRGLANPEYHVSGKAGATEVSLVESDQSRAAAKARQFATDNGLMTIYYRRGHGFQ